MAETLTTNSGLAAERIWLKSYSPAVAPDIAPLAHSSVGDAFEASVQQFGDRVAYSSMGKTMTFRELEAETRKVAAWLQSKGLKKGDRVAVMMPNILQNPVVSFAALRAGFVVVNVNPLYTPRELEHQLKDSGAKAIFVLENFAHTVEQAVAKTDLQHVVVTSMGDMLGLKGLLVNFVVRHVKKLVPEWTLPHHVTFKSVLKQGSSRGFFKPELSLSEIAFLQYTGGTTGVSKGAILTHGNILSNLAQNVAWLATAFSKRKPPEKLTFICALPLYHIFALTVNAMMGLTLGAENVLIANPRDIPALVLELKKRPFQIFPGLNTLFNALMNNPEFSKIDFSQLFLTLAGGMAVQRPVAERWKAMTGCPIAEGYGLSETSPVATANLFDATEFSGTVGLPLPSTEIEIRDDEGNTLPIGATGEICIRGPQVMAGYWNRPDETAKVMTADGFFRSGDIGIMDERGYTKIVDRKKDMILVSGFNVFPNEIEEVVAMMPDVLECAAIGVPDITSGEAVKLFVVARNANLTEAGIKAHCSENLTNYKRPKYIEFRTELPKSNVGKILRKDLRG
jgi:long-chain acyl-CoA synthetase